MKAFTAALVAATMLTAPAYAWDYNQYGSGQQIGDNASGVQNNTSQRQGQTQGQSQSSRSTSGASARSTATGGRGGSGGSVIANVGNGGGSGGNAIGLTVPGGYGNAPCGGGIGLGGLGLSGGGSGGGTLWEFGDCKRMRESSALLQLGYPDAALAELCQIDRVREAFGGRCPGEPGAVMVQMPTPPEPEYQPIRMAYCDPHTSVVWQDGSCHRRPKPKPSIKPMSMTCHDLIVETLRECRVEEKHDAR